MVLARALACVLVLAIAPAAEAQDAATRARTLFEEGVTLSDRGDFEGAVARFRQSLALVERPSTLFNLGVALRELGRVPEAIETLERFVDIADASVDEARRASARAWLTSLRARGGTLVLDYEPPRATVVVDGAEVGSDSPLVVDLAPGEHLVEVAAGGRATARFAITLAPGERVTRRIELARAAPAGSGDLGRIVGVAALGAGAASLAAAIALTVAREDTVARYHAPSCDPTTWGTRRDLCPQLRAEIGALEGGAIAWWVISAVLFGAGATALALTETGTGAHEGAIACAAALGPDHAGMGCGAHF